MDEQNSDSGIPAPRTPLHIEVEFRKNYARTDAKGTLKNISISGAFLSHEGTQLKPGEKLTLTFQVSGRVRQIAAQIIWSNKVGSGLKFKPANNKDVQIVDDLIYFVESKRSGNREIFEKILKKVS